MDISENELKYIAKIYQHGVSHLMEDTIPNKIISIHNLHWCVENLLRKATKDYNLDYKVGFQEIFKKFIKKGNKQPPNSLVESIWKLNEMRNGIEHREIYPDYNIIKNLVPGIERFIKWILKKIFNESIDPFLIYVADESNILNDFNTWIEEKKKTLEREKEIYDFIFFCLIPSTFSEGLVDFSFDGINPMIGGETATGVKVFRSNPEHYPMIEHYFSGCHKLFGNSQIYSVPTHFEYINESYGNEIKIFSDGRIYACYKYGSFTPEDLSFHIENIYNFYETFKIEKHSEKYGIPITEYRPYILEDILKIICFAFHPNCKEKIVNNPTRYFRGFFILPNMRYKGRNRVLNRPNKIFDHHREYAGDEDYIKFSKTFAFEQISDLVNEFKNYVYGFYKNKQSTAFN